MKTIVKCTLIFFLIIFQIKPIFAQDTAPEEIEKIVNQAENDTLLCELYYKISSENLSSNPLKGKEYAYKQLKLAERLSHEAMLTAAYINLSMSNANLEFGDSAL